MTMALDNNAPVTSPALLGFAAPQLIRRLFVAPTFTPQLGIAIALIVILTVHYARSPWRHVPPGPKRLPVLGNALQLQDKAWMFGRDCKRDFGAFCLLRAGSVTLQVDRNTEHMMYLNALGQPILVFNSLKSAFGLLDRRANIYSDRPRLTVAHEILCGGLFTAFMSYGDVSVYHSLPFVWKIKIKFFVVGVALAGQRTKCSPR